MLIVGEFYDLVLLKKIFIVYDIEVVIYFVVFVLVGELVVNLVKYYDNNVVVIFWLFEVMCELDVCKIVFFSICVIYGVF